MVRRPVSLLTTQEPTTNDEMWDRVVGGVQAENAAGSIWSSQYVDPSQAGRANELARRLGIPADLVQADLPGHIAQDRQQAAQAAARDNPVYARMMQNPRFAAAASGDNSLRAMADHVFRAGLTGMLLNPFSQTPQGMVVREAGRRNAAVMHALTHSPLTDIIASSGNILGESLAGAGEATYDLLTLRSLGAQTLQEQLRDRLREGRQQGTLNAQGEEVLRSLGDGELDPVRRRLQDMRRYYQETRPEYQIQTGNPYIDAALRGFESVPMQLTALYTAATGNPRTAVAMMASVSGGQAYGQARDAGLTPGQSLTYAATQGGLEALGEALPIGRFVEDVLQGSGFLRTMGRQFIAENLGEQFTQHAQDFVQWAEIDANQGKTLGDYLAERPRVARDTFIATTAAVGLQTPLARVILQATRRAAEADDARQTESSVDQLMATAADSETRRTNPTDFQEALATALEGSPSENLYIPAEQVRQLFQAPSDMEQDPFWRDHVSQINEAEALGGDVVIPLAAAVTHLAGSSQWEALKDHVRTSAGAMSRVEARTAQEELPRTLAEHAPALAQEIADQEAEEAPRQQVFDAMRGKLEAAGFRPDVASQYAELFSARAATRAQRLGRDLTGVEADAVAIGDQSGATEGRTLEQSMVMRAIVGGALAVSHPSPAGRGQAPTVATESTPSAWQDQYARADWRDHLTHLDEGQEAQFQRWAETNHAPITDDYDMRGFWLHGGRTEINRNDGQLHFPDTYKTPLHQSFSGESVFADPATHPPAWNERDQLIAPDGRVLFDERAPRTLHQNERGRITFTADGKSIIDLFANRDLSTFIHESGHDYLEQLKVDAQIATELDTPEGRQLFADYETVKAWFKREGHAIGEDGTIPTEAHELFARGFERYALEGKAPSQGLKRAFAAFRSWLLNIYKTVRGLRAPITPEIREVMDRLLATDEEIANATEEQGIKLGFESADVARMTGPEFTAYQRLAEEAKDEAHTKLLEEVMATVRARRTKEYREQEADTRREIGEQIDAQPVFRALAMLRAKEAGLKLDRQFLLDSYGADALDRVPQSVPPIHAAEGGTHPDVIAEQAGFSTGDEMINALMDHEAQRKQMRADGDKRTPRQAAIDQTTAQVMGERYGDPLQAGTIEEEARAIVHNDKQGEVFAAELRALGRQTGRKPTPYRIARQWAGERVAGGQVQSVASGGAVQRYARAAAKSGRAFEQALAKGDTDEAFRHKQAQMLNNALVAAAKEAKDRIDVSVRRLGKLARAKTRASMDQDYLDQIHGLLEQVELRPRSQASLDEQQSYEAWADEQRKSGIDLVKEPSFAASLGKTHWSRLSVEQLLGLDDTVQQIAHLGRLKQTLFDGQERRKFEDGRDELIASADGSGKGRKISALNDPRRSLPQRTKSWIRMADAAMIKVEQMVDWLDGGKSTGPWNRLMFKPLADAQGSDGDLMRTYVEQVNALIKAMPRKQARDWDRKVDTPELRDRVSSDPTLHGRPMEFGKDQIVAMALNWGNAGNKQRLLDGYGWKEQDVQAVFDRLMTPEDWQFVQSIWDTLETLKAPLFEMERRVNGVEPDAVEAAPVETKHGTFAGGYFPAVYDATYQTQKQLSDAEQMIGGGGFFRASTRSSATKERAAAVRKPLLLSMSVITNHMRSVIHDITHREAVMQAGKILADGKVRAAIDRKLGPEYVKAMDAWLTEVAKPGTAESVLGSFATWIGRYLHKGTTVAGLGFRMSTILMQPLGLSNIVGAAGTRAVAEGMATFTAHPRRTYNEVIERSAEMRDRFSTLDASIADAYRDQGKSSLRKLGPGKIMKAAFYGIGFTDMLITTGGWIGSFNKGLREGMTEEEATYYADKVIRTSQGAAGAKDRSGALRAPQLIRAFYPFFSYMNALYNQQRDIGRDVRNVSSASGVAKIIGKTWWIAVVPALAQAALFGQGPDEDDEESWAAYLTRNAILGNFSSIPGIGPIGNAVGNGWSYRSGSVQNLGEQVVNTAKNVKALVDGDDDTNPRSDWIKSMFTLIGTLTHQPLGAPGAAVQFLAGDDEPENVGDWYEGLTTGRNRDR